MIKWTFFFVQEGSVKTEVSVEAEDSRIAEFIEKFPNFLFLPGDKTDLYVNLDQVKCLARQCEDDDQDSEIIKQSGQQIAG